VRQHAKTVFWRVSDPYAVLALNVGRSRLLEYHRLQIRRSVSAAHVTGLTVCTLRTSVEEKHGQRELCCVSLDAYCRSANPTISRNIINPATTTLALNNSDQRSTITLATTPPMNALGEIASSDDADDGSNSASDDHTPRRGASFSFLNTTDSISRPLTPERQQRLDQGESSSSRSHLPPTREEHPTETKVRRGGTFSMRDMLRPVGSIDSEYLPEPEVSSRSKPEGGTC
jgi:hypothetical protein